MADILLKNRAGEDVAYSGINAVVFDTAAGDQAVFSRGAAVAGSAAADFSGGDQVITPAEGTLFSSLTLEKPPALLPENIVKDVNIAGIWGNYIGGHNIVSASGSFTATGTGQHTVPMPLGVIPDVIFVMVKSGYNAGYLTHCFGVSGDLAEKISFSPQHSIIYGASSVQISGSYGIDEEDAYGNGFISDAGPSSFKVGGSILKLYSGASYLWYAIGGVLTHSGYFYLKTAMPDDATLVITGGVPQIQQIAIYVDGVLGKTVPYVHGDSFTVDVSDIADDYRAHTFTLKALGDDLQTLYPKQYCDPVSNSILAGGDLTDTVKWTIYRDGLMRIHGSGEMVDYASKDAITARPWHTYADQITSLRVEAGIVRTGNRCFYSFTNLKSAYVAEGVALGTHLFYGCSSLTDFTIPSDITELPASAFMNCTSLTHYTIPDTVLTMGSSALRGCTALRTVTLNDKLQSIGTSAFSDCAALEKIVIPDSVTRIDNYAFARCKAMSSVTLGSSLQRLDYYVFLDCTALTSITIPASVTSIGYYAFSGCGVTSVIFADTTTWMRYASDTATSGTTITASYLGNASTAATYLKTTYVSYWWKKT